MRAIDQTDQMADRVRSELVLTLRELERRRQVATDVPYQLQKHMGLIASAAGAAVVALGIGVVVARVRSRNRRSVLFQERMRAVIRAWENPERIATRAKNRHLPTELGRKVVLAFAMALVARLAKQSAKRVAPTSTISPSGKVARA